jgi:hypothetical protein
VNRAVFLLVAATLPARATAGVAASELAGKAECPVALARYQGGSASEQQKGIVVAVWRDGTIVRAADPRKPWAKHVVGTLDAEDKHTLAAILDHGDIWDSPRGEVGIDLPQEWLVLQRGSDRWAWWESPGVTRTRWLQETIAKLLRFHVRSATALIGVFDDDWECGDGRLQHEPVAARPTPRPHP